AVAADGGGGARLLLEALGGLARGGRVAGADVQREHLERQERVGDLDVAHAVDRAHAALAELLLDEVLAEAQSDPWIRGLARGLSLRVRPGVRRLWRGAHGDPATISQLLLRRDPRGQSGLLDCARMPLSRLDAITNELVPHYAA